MFDQEIHKGDINVITQDCLPQSQVEIGKPRIDVMIDHKAVPRFLYNEDAE